MYRNDEARAQVSPQSNEPRHDTCLPFFCTEAPIIVALLYYVGGPGGPRPAEDFRYYSLVTILWGQLTAVGQTVLSVRHSGFLDAYG